MPWDLSGNTPIYSQIIEHIKMCVALGNYKCGDKLPAVRELAAEASVNPNTMQKALSELEKDGLLYTQRTAGRFITEDAEVIRKLREDLATNHIEYYLTKMKSLGYSKEEAISMLEKYKF